VRAGQLDRRIRLEAPATVIDTSGSWTEGFTAVADVWAGKRDTRGAERIEAGTETTVADALYRIRFRSDIQPRWRLIDLARNQAWDIVGIAEIGRRDGLELACTRVGEQ
jgi:SPP1 family predicted phage head-tail adaptor